ncbi:MAG: hypothetical protein ABUL58_06970 [Steroidobacter sp.]
MWNMGTVKLAVIIAAIVSIFLNIWLVRKIWHHEEAPVIHTVITDAPVVMRTNGGLLEVSTITSPERFESTIDHTILGVPVATTVTTIRVPATYRYHIDLAPEWKILLRDKTFVVVAPAVKPSLPVAINTAKLEAQSLGVWSLFTGHAEIEQLQRSITQALADKAGSTAYIQMQRESARATVKEFVAKWLITQEQWKSATSYPIKVFFSDEPIQALGSIPPPFVTSP